MAKQLRLDVAQLTDVGRKREHNEDNMAYVIPKDAQVMARKGALFIVADGMGGHAAGEVASEIAVDTVSNAYYQDDNEDVAVSLLQAIKRANALIHQRAAENMQRSGMGTTCVAAVLRGNMAYIANVGDSRAYFMRHGQVKQVSQDHSWVAEQVRAGLLTDDQARTHAQRNVITRCLGTQADVDVDVFTEELQEGDSLVLCTDGLSGLVSDDEIRRIVEQYVPQESVYHLIEQANNNGGPDNITAIVLRVIEVGVEPPGVRHPVGVGGRETGEDTAILGMLPGVQPGAPRAVDGRVPSAPLRYSSGPLSPLADSVTAPQPILAPSPRRSRLLYPSLAICILLVVAFVGTGAYYFLGARSDTTAQSIQQARALITQAQSVSSSNGAAALQDLSHAQSILQGLQSDTLSSDQQTTVNSLLQTNLTSAVQQAITNYNQQSKISILPCASQPTVGIINEGSTNAVPQSLAAVAMQGNKGTLFYTRANDSGLYQISNQFGLVSRLNLPNGTNVLAITGDNNRLFLLTSEPSTNKNGYKLGLLLPGQSTLKSTLPVTDSDVQSGRLQPTLMTAWGNDLYVVLTQTATVSNSSSNIVILDYTVGANNTLSANETRFPLAASTTVTSVAAFPNHELFLLLQGGTIWNLQLNVKNPAPISVLVHDSIATPLKVTASEFHAGMTVPTVTASTQSGNVPLNVVDASQLTAGAVSGQTQPHLYVVDPANNRLLDLQISASTSATPTPTPTATASTGNGGSVAGGSSVTVALNQQYVSTNFFANMRNVVTDPKGLPIYMLTQTASQKATNSSLSLVSLDPSAFKGSCA
ncbi:MAG TPA: Stp1/IreP family PP2C-type Ser/Thr phosphatase [Ktedonobacteraceae bacterium]|nr:Stp1/IreP family PP2C-type Ser/Thr phosphatase [Ktedonobacteraceae bacterium]